MNNITIIHQIKTGTILHATKNTERITECTECVLQGVLLENTCGLETGSVIPGELVNREETIGRDEREVPVSVLSHSETFRFKSATAYIDPILLPSWSRTWRQPVAKQRAALRKSTRGCCWNMQECQKCSTFKTKKVIVFILFHVGLKASVGLFFNNLNMFSSHAVGYFSLTCSIILKISTQWAWKRQAVSVVLDILN